MKKKTIKLFTIILLFTFFFSSMPKNDSAILQVNAVTVTKSSIKKQISKIKKEITTLKKKDKEAKKGSTSILGTIISNDPFVVKVPGYFGSSTYYYASDSSNASVYFYSCSGYFKKNGKYKKFDGHTCVAGKFVTRKYERELKKKQQRLKKLETAMTNKVSITYDENCAAVGETIYLIANKRKKDSYNKISWESSNNSIATVSKYGAVKGKKAGSVKITAKMSVSGKKSTVKLTFVQPAQKITLNSNDISLEMEHAYQLKGIILPENSKKDIYWDTSNKKIAAVTNNGLVKAVGLGEATITAKTHNGLSAKCKVKVIDSSENITLSETNINLERYISKTINENIFYNVDTDTIYNMENYSTSFRSEYKLFCFKDILGDEFDEKEYLDGEYDEIIPYESYSYKGPFGNVDRYPYIRLEYDITAKTNYKVDDISWESSNDEVAVINEYGIIAILNPGITSISATLPSGKTAICTLSVTAKDTVFDDEQYYDYDFEY